MARKAKLKHLQQLATAFRTQGLHRCNSSSLVRKAGSGLAFKPPPARSPSPITWRVDDASAYCLRPELAAGNEDTGVHFFANRRRW